MRGAILDCTNPPNLPTMALRVAIETRASVLQSVMEAMIIIGPTFCQVKSTLEFFHLRLSISGLTHA